VYGVIVRVHLSVSTRLRARALRLNSEDTEQMYSKHVSVQSTLDRQRNIV